MIVHNLKLDSPTVCPSIADVLPAFMVLRADYHLNPSVEQVLDNRRYEIWAVIIVTRQNRIVQNDKPCALLDCACQEQCKPQTVDLGLTENCYCIADLDIAAIILRREADLKVDGAPGLCTSRLSAN
jgi:hypothetical protein